MRVRCGFGDDLRCRIPSVHHARLQRWLHHGLKGWLHHGLLLYGDTLLYPHGVWHQRRVPGPIPLVLDLTNRRAAVDLWIYVATSDAARDDAPRAQRDHARVRAAIAHRHAMLRGDTAAAVLLTHAPFARCTPRIPPPVGGAAAPHHAAVARLVVACAATT